MTLVNPEALPHRTWLTAGMVVWIAGCCVGNVWAASGPIDLGSAGPKNWAVLALGGPTDLSMANTSTVQGLVPNVGVAATGNFSFSDASRIAGQLFMNQAGQVQQGDQSVVSGGIVRNADAFLNQAVQDALAESTRLAGFLATIQTSPSLLIVDDSQNLTITGLPGVNVLQLTDLVIRNQGTLTLDAPAGSVFILNISGRFKLFDNGQIVLAPSVAPFSVVFNVIGQGDDNETEDVNFAGRSALSGIVLAPQRSVHLSGQAVVTGEVIAGGPSLSLKDSAQITNSYLPPTITFNASPLPNAAGWNNTNVTVSFVCSASATGVASCPGPVTVTMDGAGQVISGTVVDYTGAAATTSVTLNVDKTPPAITGTVEPSPNSAGWNNSPATVTFACSDTTSGVASCPAPSMVSAEGANQTVTGTAADKAGNTANTSVRVNIDKTPPTITATAAPAPNAAGWNNTTVTITFSCADSLSGVATCPGPSAVTADGAGQTVAATAFDKAGNTATTSATVNIDKTPPTITATISPTPNAAGWNNTTVTVTFVCSDAGSGIGVCPAPVQVTTEGTGQVVSGTALDKAGNSASVSVTVNIDLTAPGITVTGTPAPNAAGWNNTNVTVTFTCSDALSGVAGCPAANVVSTEGASQTISGTATDKAGNTASTTATISLDKTPPTITATVAPSPNAAGWNNGSVTVSFTCSDALSGVASCPPPVVVMTEGAGQVISGTATDRAGNTASASVTVNLDMTVPTITGAIAPPPNAAGWNNANVTVTFTCADSLSGVVTCSGPLAFTSEGQNQAAVGAVTDKAGNTATVTIPVNLDKTPPVLTILSPASGTQANPGPISVTGAVTDALSGVAGVTCQGTPATLSGTNFSCSVTIAQGPNSIGVQATDVAGNTTQASVSVQGGIPAILSATPNTGQQGQQNESVTLTGQFAHWVQGTTTASFGAGITVVSLTINSATTATTVLSIDAGATVGARDVAVTTGNEVVTLSSGFTVDPGMPELLAVNPSAGQQGQQNESVTLTGLYTHWVPGATTALFGPGITVTSLTVNQPVPAYGSLLIGNPTLGFVPLFPATAAYGLGASSPPTTVTLNNVQVSSLGGAFVAPLPSGTVLEVVVTDSFPSDNTGAGFTLSQAPGSCVAQSNGACFIIPLNFASPVQAYSGPSFTLGQTLQPTDTLSITVSGTACLQSGGAYCTNAAGVAVVAGTSPVGGSSLDNVNAAFYGGTIVTSATAVINIDAAAATGPRDVTVTSGPEAVTLSNGFTINPGTPVLTTVNPNTGQQGQQNLSVNLTGQFTHWVQGTTTATFGTGVTVSSLTVNSASNATAVLNIDPAATVGANDVIVATGAEVVTLKGGFTVKAGTPMLISVSPNSGQQGQQNLSVTITGRYTHFGQGLTTGSFGPGVSVGGAASGGFGPVNVTSATSATALLAIDASASGGARVLTIQTGAEQVLLSNALVVATNQPPVTSVGSNQTITLPTDGFEGASITPFWTVSGPGLTTLTTSAAHSGAQSLQEQLVSMSPFNSVVKHDFGSAQTGSVAVYSRSALGAAAQAGLQIDDANNNWLAVIEYSTFTNNFAARVNHGASESDTNFSGDPSVWHLFEINVNSSGVVLKFDGTVVLADPSVTSFRFIDLTTWSGPSGAAYFDDFTTTISATLLNGSITDDGLPAGATLSTSWSQNSGPGAVTFGTPTETFSDTPGQVNAVTTSATFSAPGTYTLGLAGTDSQLSSSSNVTITVNEPPAAILSLSPGSGQQGQQNLSVTLTGQFTHWAQGTTTADFGVGITVGTLTVNSPISATAVLNIDPAAATGARSVTITTGPEVAASANGFNINSSTPLLTLANPSSGQQGQLNLAITITGQFTHFAPGGTQLSLGPDVAVSSVTVASSTSLTAVIGISIGAAPGLRTITVTTGSEVVSLSGFVITPAPLLLSISPDTGAQGEQSVPFTFTGDIIGWWRFEESSAGSPATVPGSIMDSSSSHLAGTPFGSPVYLADAGSVPSSTLGLEFNSARIFIPDSPALALTKSLTIDVYVRIDSPISGCCGLGQILFRGDDRIGLDPYYLAVDSFNRVVFHVENAQGRSDVVSQSALPAGQFVRVTATLDDAVNDQRIYFNGVLAGEQTTAIRPFASLDPTFNPGVGIGSSQGVAFPEFFNGAIDEVLIRNAPVGPGDIRSVTVAGENTHFTNSSVIDLGPGIAIGQVQASDATHMTAQLSIASDSPTGLRDLTVTTGPEVVKLAGAFTVQPTPVLVSLIPSSGYQGQQNLLVTITGQFTSFAQNSTQVSFGADITANSVAVASGTSLNVNITIPISANLGGHTVTVTTGGEVLSLVNAFNITP